MNPRNPTNGNPIDEPKDVVILFPDDWAAFSPTLIRLTTLLAETFAVRVYVFDTGRIDNAALDSNHYRHIRIPSLLAKLLRKTGIYRIFRTISLAVSARHDATRAAHVIAVDADGAAAARIIGKKFHFLSLEIGWHPILRYLVRKHALSIVSQSEERLYGQFSHSSIAAIPVFFVQNAPNCPSDRKNGIKRPSPDFEHPRLIHLGHSLPLHGLIPMLELARLWPAATLTLQGIHPDKSMKIMHERYGDLMDQGRVRISSGYIPDEGLEHFLHDFDIGLCLYEIDRRHRGDFNYLSSPSGKMFNYFHAGIPVIASSQIGLNPVSLHRAGIQAPGNDIPTLLTAARTILADYQSYSDGCFRASATYDFKASAHRFVDFLRKE